MVLLGAFHHDPFGKNRLIQVLRGLSNERGRQIDAIGLEWAQTTYNALVPKRGALGSLLKEKRPELSIEFCTAMGHTLAYEGDLPDSVPPKSGVLWLLDGRDRDDVAITGNGIVRRAVQTTITDIDDWLLPRLDIPAGASGQETMVRASGIYLNESRRLSSLSDDSLKAREVGRSIGSGRDEYMFSVLMGRLRSVDSTNLFIAVVIGAAHLLDVQGSFVNLCRSEKLDIEVLWPHEQQSV